MSAWTGFGMNIGYDNWSDSAYYNWTQFEADLTYLGSIGITKFRTINHSYDTSAYRLARVQEMVTRILAHGFSVNHGMSMIGATGTATRWGLYKTYVSGTLAPWAQSLNNPNLIISLGNEEENHADGSTLTAATVRSDIRSLATAVQGIYTVGEVHYTAAATQQGSWAGEGIGALDKIGFNHYWSTSVQAPGGFASQIISLKTNFGSTAYVSEWNTANGYPDLADERAYAENIRQRIQVLSGNNASTAYFFCYRDANTTGLTNDCFAAKLLDNSFRMAFDEIRVSNSGRRSIVPGLTTAGG